MQKDIIYSTFALNFVLTSTGVTRADATLTFTPSTLDIVAGGTVEFDGTLTNTGDTDLYLNGDSFLLSFPDLNVDDSPFFFDGPTFLAAGDSFTGAFIDVTAGATILSGSYSGTFTIQGGTDSNTYDDISTEEFTLDVGSPVPEPNPFLLLASGMAMLAFAGLRRDAFMYK
jgi:hypothetical protein